MPPTEPNDEERQQQLPGDGQTPFQPADPNPAPTGNTTDPVVGSTDNDLPDDHQATDTNVDPQETYDEGTAGAAEVSDQTADNAVTGYTPPASPTTDGTTDTTPPADDPAAPDAGDDSTTAV